MEEQLELPFQYPPCRGFDRSGQEVFIGDLVLAPLNAFDPGRGHFYTFGIGTVERIWEHVGHGNRGPVVAVHTKYQTTHCLAKRTVVLTERE